MKRIIALLAVLLSLLSGCANRYPEETGAWTEHQTEATAGETHPQSSIMDGREPVGELGNLWYLPNEAVEPACASEMYRFGDGLLTMGMTADDNGCRTDLRLISLVDGSLLGEISFSSNGVMQIQIGQNVVGICDSACGNVRLLDQSLTLIHTYTRDADFENWALSRDLETLYIFDYEHGLYADHLATGEKERILDGTRVSVCGRNMQYVVFTYVDRQTQRSAGACLNLETGLLEALPGSASVCSAARVGDIWLTEDWDAADAYRLITREGTKALSVTDGWLELLDSGYLLAHDYNRTLTLYDTDGSYVSRCELPQGTDCGVGASFVWDDSREGFFFTDYYEGKTRLMFWDPLVETAGESLVLSDVEEMEIPGGTVVSQALYDRAAELSRRFDLDIRIADQCALGYGTYDAQPLENPEIISQSLDVLESALLAYPEGFFTQLKFGSMDTIRVEIVGSMPPREGAGVIADAAGFAQQMRDYYLVALDGRTLTDNTVYHEFSHVIDSRLDWDAGFREDALYSEQTWLRLQPEGFDYAYSYEMIQESVTQYYGSGYFTESYACTFPTEDRATLMAAVMSGATYLYYSNPGLEPKLEYYCRCIRDCFDTTGWPEKTAWETVLGVG